MKRNLILLTILCVCMNHIHGQVVTTMCDALYQPVSTDWQDPSNTNLPLTYPNRYLNHMDWNQNSFPLPGMSFNNISLGPKTSLDNSQLGPYYSYIYYESPAHKHLPSEGWELLLINVGKYPDDQTLLESNLYSALPYVVLYNRYKGVIRVFVGMGPDADISNSADALSVELFFTEQSKLTNKLSGLLRLYEGSDKPLDQPTSAIRSMTVGKAVTELSRWASVDFQMAYDPCSCKTPSILGLTFTHIKTQTLSLYGRAVGITDNDIMTDEMEVNPTDFLSSFNYDDITGNAKEGMVISKALTNTLDEYIVRYEKYQKNLADVQKHNEKVNNNLAILKFGKYAFSVASTLGGGLTSDLLPMILQNAGASYALDYLASNNYNSWGATVDDADWFKRSTKAVQGIIKKVNGQYEKLDEKELFKVLKQIFGEDANTFISSNFEIKPAPNKPEEPTNSITYTEMKFEGVVTTNTLKVGPTFFLPGSYGATRGNTPANNPLSNWDDIFQYPVYNDVLGTFALLESPKLKVSASLAGDLENTILQRTEYGGNGHYALALYRYQAWTKQFQVQLAEPLKFTFNPVLDIKKYNVQAAYEITATPKVLAATPLTISNSFVDPNHQVNIDITDVQDNSYVPLLAGGNAYHYGHGIPSPYFDFYVPLDAPQTHHSSVKYITPYLPLDAFQPFVTEVGVRNEAINLRNIDVPYTPSSLPNYYNVTTLGDGSIFFNNPNVFPQPSQVTPASFGYEYDLKIKLKLIVDIEFNSNNFAGDPNTTTLTLTYDVDQAHITPLTSDIVPNLETSGGNIFQYEENLLLNATNFSGQAVEGCKLVGNTYTCRSWNNINVEGDLSVTGNYNVNIIAGNQIDVNPESVISPEIVLYIQPVLNSSSPMPASSQTYVNNFCNGTNPNAPSYHANFSKEALDKAYNDSIAEGELQKIPFDFHLYPNPTDSRATVLVEGEGASQAVIRVFDITGKLQGIAIEYRGDNKYDLDVDGLASGIYLVKVSTFGESGTKQLVIK